MIYYGHKMQKTQITIVKGGKNMNYEKEKNGTRKIAKVIIPVIAIIGIIAIVLTATCCGSLIRKKIYQTPKIEIPIESYFVEYDDMTLIKATSYPECSNNIFTTTIRYHEYIGFIDNDIYEKYRNGEYEGIVEVYHPYVEGKSIIAKTENFQSVEKLLYSDCYNEYPPSEYK